MTFFAISNFYLLVQTYFYFYFSNPFCRVSFYSVQFDWDELWSLFGFYSDCSDCEFDDPDEDREDSLPYDQSLCVSEDYQDYLGCSAFRAFFVLACFLPCFGYQWSFELVVSLYFDCYFLSLSLGTDAAAKSFFYGTLTSASTFCLGGRPGLLLFGAQSSSQLSFLRLRFILPRAVFSPTSKSESSLSSQDLMLSLSLFSLLSLSILKCWNCGLLKKSFQQLFLSLRLRSSNFCTGLLRKAAVSLGSNSPRFFCFFSGLRVDTNLVAIMH